MTTMTTTSSARNDPARQAPSVRSREDSRRRAVLARRGHEAQKTCPFSMGEESRTSHMKDASRYLVAESSRRSRSMLLRT